MSLLFNMLSRLVITFLSRSKCLNFMATVTIYGDFGAQKSQPLFLHICHKVIGPDTMNLVFWMLRFKPTFSLSSLTLIKRFFSASSLSAIRVVSSAYLRLLIFLPAICLTLWDPLDCSLPGSSIHGIFQARILEWVAVSFSRSSWHRVRTLVSHIVGRRFTVWATFRPL